MLTVSPSLESVGLTALVWNSQTIVLQVVKPVEDQGSFLFLMQDICFKNTFSPLTSGSSSSSLLLSVPPPILRVGGW